MDMEAYSNALTVMGELFSKDCLFALATSSGKAPSARMVDVYYENSSFYIVTYANTAKAKELAANEKVALCSGHHRFQGIARNIGHPLEEANAALRERLIRVFAPRYFAHNSEKDADMCYVRVDPLQGFFHKDGTGYRVNFQDRTVETCPFTDEVVLPSADFQ